MHGTNDGTRRVSTESPQIISRRYVVDDNWMKIIYLRVCAELFICLDLEIRVSPSAVTESTEYGINRLLYLYLSHKHRSQVSTVTRRYYKGT